MPSYSFCTVFLHFGKPLTCFCTLCVQETLENVKKCRNFLSTLIKLTSNGKQSSETTANVKELIKKLLVDLPSHQSAFPSSIIMLCCFQFSGPCVLCLCFLLCDYPTAGSKNRARRFHQQVIPGAQLLATAIPCAFLKGEVCDILTYADENPPGLTSPLII